MPVTDVKKYDINRRIYLPKWVEEELGINPGESYVTFVRKGDDIVIKRVRKLYCDLHQDQAVRCTWGILVHWL